MPAHITTTPTSGRGIPKAAGGYLLFALCMLGINTQALAVECTPANTVVANVVALDQPLMFNRLGAQNVNGMIYALQRDVVAVDPVTRELLPGAIPGDIGSFTPGNVTLRPDKRPRPLTLRVPAGDCLQVNLSNMLAPVANPFNAAEPLLNINDQPADRHVSFHSQGLELVDGIADDGSFTGRNESSLVLPGNSHSYMLYAPKEGTFLAVSYGATLGGDGAGGTIASGLWGVVTVQPPGAAIYRSQVTEEELRLASLDLNPASGSCGQPAISVSSGHPIIDYEARYPSANCNNGTDLGAAVWNAEGKAGRPIINMIDTLANNEFVHNDINAVVAYGGGDYQLDGNGHFPAATYPLESQGQRNPTVPTRLEPFREFMVAFHDEIGAAQVFPKWFADPVLGHTLHGVRDSFMINYGSGGIGSEIIANRLGVGPMHDCLSCAYEEFFLTAYTVGDPAMVVDIPANTGLEACDPALNNCEAVGPKAFEAFYPDDPSNVHHSYTGDPVKFRNLHAGPKEQHVFHLHNHQWLFNPNDDNSNYLDAQGIGPGSGYTYEINFGGSGNRNKSSGDAIFHCHFYPHFAQGMWEMWRIYDTFQVGTELAVSISDDVNDVSDVHDVTFALQSGMPAAGARALPDGEILAGTPIPAVVPLPGRPMAPMPSPGVTVVDNGNQICVDPVLFGTAPVNADGSCPTGMQLRATGSLASIDRGPLFTTDENGNTVPSGLNPGYPFWIAGIEQTVGQRPPTPPMDMKVDATNHQNGGWDGGLPRHALEGYAAGGASVSSQSRLDMSKEITVAKPVWFPEDGTDIERVAMAYHAKRCHDTSLPNGAAANCAADDTGGYLMNGAPAIAGAPYADPCIDDLGRSIESNVPANFFDAVNGMNNIGLPIHGSDNPRVYKAANLQFDAVFNKAGYHFPQERIIALWEDVVPIIDKTKPPEPFVIRMNTFDCTMYLHTNLVPKEYELDDYQIRTPTDIIGQHIHLPKWDLTTTDGSANGWNYEDGTLSPGMVVERIEAINQYNLANAPVLTDVQGNSVTNSEGHTIGSHLEPLPHPFFGTGLNDEWLGARTTLQRWFADPVFNVEGEDRGLGIIFTHDHYGPSTHQQIGLYATVLTEPAGSKWYHNETGEEMYTRQDGGPTSWQAAIEPPSGDAYREFYFEYSDFQHAYEAGVYIGAGPDGRPNHVQPDAASFVYSINPSYRQQANPTFPDVGLHPGICPGGVPRPCPEAITADDSGMLVVNYRNEPVGLRVFDPIKSGPDGKPGTQADGDAGDLAFALQSRGDRALAVMNAKPSTLTSVTGPTGGVTVFPPHINAAGDGNGDPFTPMLRVQAGDLVRVKIQAGGHEHEHNASIQGLKWLQAGSGFGAAPNSGWRSSQNAGISEQFTFSAPVQEFDGQRGNVADRYYSMDMSQDGFWSGMWGLMRTYGTLQNDLHQLSNGLGDFRIANAKDYEGVCPKSAPLRQYDISAVLANAVLENALGLAIVPADTSATQHEGGALDPNGGTLVYNPRPTQIQAFNVPLDGGGNLQIGGQQGPLHDPTAMLYVMTQDLWALGTDGAFLVDNEACYIDTKGKGNVVFSPLNAQLAGQACPLDAGCVKTDPKSGKQKFEEGIATCPAKLRPGAPVEPVVVRAAAGDCIEVTLRNRLPDDLDGNGFLDDVPDLAGFNTLLQVVNRDRDPVNGLTWFHNNLIRPSSHAAIEPQLVSIDVTRDSGVSVGINPSVVAVPGKEKTMRWYAGHTETLPDPRGVVLKSTPVELGGANLMPADVIKQGQKGMVGGLVVHPEGSSWSETDLVRDRQGSLDGNGQVVFEGRETRTSATVTKADGTARRDFVTVFQKGLNHRFGDGEAVPNIASEGQGIPEDSHDAGQMAINYASEPLWFRFGVPAEAPFGRANGAGHGDISNAHMAHSNALAGAGCAIDRTLPECDPVTPVFTTTAGDEVLMHVIEPRGVGRGTTFNLHGHNWLRDPYLAGSVPSQTIGDNPMGMTLGHQESVTPGAHFDILLKQAGGAFNVAGDYLFRDQGSFGNLGGLWGILRVEPNQTP